MTGFRWRVGSGHYPISHGLLTNSDLLEVIMTMIKTRREEAKDENRRNTHQSDSPPSAQTNGSGKSGSIQTCPSIQAEGLREPIDVLEVDGEYYGFSGCHRYEAEG